MMELPPQPQFEAFHIFDGQYDKNAYYTALGAWERVCKHMIDKSTELALVVKGLKK